MNLRRLVLSALGVALVIGWAGGLLANNGDEEDLLSIEDSKRVAENAKARQAALEGSGATNGTQHEEAARQYAQAVANIARTADKRPGSPRIQREAGRALLELDEPKQALPLADRAVALAPRDPEARLIRGQAHYKLGHYGRAAEEAREVLTLSPRNRMALALLGLSRGRSGASAPPGRPPPETAPPAAGSSPRPYPAQAEAASNRIKAAGYLSRAEQKIKLGDSQEALRLLERAIALDPKSPGARVERAKARRGLGDPEGALAEAEEALRLEPRQAEALLLRGQARENLGHSPSAILADFQAATELDGSFASFYKQALERYQKGGAAALRAEASGEAGKRQGASGARLAKTGAERASGPLPWPAAILSAAALLLIAAFVLWLRGRCF